ncbi:MAG: hypothetical protein ACPGQL_02865 [Thermoplasmatota archaeon]
MRVMALLTALALVLAGCTSSTDDDAAGGPGGSATTYQVPIEAAHALAGDDRTITVKVSQDGQELKRGTYTTAGKAVDDYEVLFTATAKAGALKIETFDGANPTGFKTIDPSRCGDPNLQVHVVDSAVHLFSNCD